MIKEKPKCYECDKYLSKRKKDAFWHCKQCKREYYIDKQCSYCSRSINGKPIIPVYLMKKGKDWICPKCGREYYDDGLKLWTTISINDIFSTSNSNFSQDNFTYINNDGIQSYHVTIGNKYYPIGEAQA